MNALLVKTPNYVLLDGQHHNEPESIALHVKSDRMAVYGFSDKKAYAAFCENSERALMPYPLVKGYLKNQLEHSEDLGHLVVLDAAGPHELRLNASAMQSVLEALESKASHVAVSFILARDEQSNAYRVESVPSDLVSANQDVSEV